MGEKNSHHLPLDEEKVLDFEVAKDLTIEEAVKKHKEIEAGVTEDDGLLDRYIKQHRAEIESQKFETKINHLPLVEVADEEKNQGHESAEEVEANESSLTEVSEEIAPIVEELSVTPMETLEETVIASTVAMEGLSSVADDSSLELEEDESEDLDHSEGADRDQKKKFYFWSAVGLSMIGVMATALVWMNSVNKSNTATSSSSTSTSQTSSTASSSTDANVTAFEQLYNSFFTDSSLTKLKNSEFGKLAELKVLLEKLDKNSDSYTKAKEQYDRLEKAIAAIQAINDQFDKEVVVNGEIDTTATVKSGESLSATTTGISAVDSLLASVVNFGRSQQEVASATVASEATVTSNQGADETVSTSVPATTEVASTTVSGSTTDFGIAVPAGVVLQRDRSRVPYNQAMIDDVNNEAWNFNPGILENIVTISQQRGYITGNQYILEKVNIINGNGYYNMFKPDGTYLFSINCKTGYFVGNGAGHSDALDY
ncbi:cell division site-positioning protein MapZ family protein [Streptococcus suis]|uniref:cell division site-positioning protein MapZ family protein n=1 Tax=Streptococcus suis TaxID=1307 RepID=UPI00237CBB9C|nr:cell division site-positioning protein MapZ family protein [Streptococcus suis]MDE1692608.1 cell division site-positioning protein MapZ family protein [Streptococcus suis]MDE3734488.1 cell division site-positioning protein MapZ family protein [Streptococcus suis]